MEVQIHDKAVPVTWSSNLAEDKVGLAIQCRPFVYWLKQMNLPSNQHLDIRSIEIQNIDMFGPRVG